MESYLIQLDRFELEARLIYCIFVAGKTATFANNKMELWLKYNIEIDETPFSCCERLMQENKLEQSFKDVKTGKYSTLIKAVEYLIDANLDLQRVKPDELEKIPGIGPKSSRFFVVWTRSDERYAVLDTHILKWLGSIGYKVPKSTPQNSKKYLALEGIFLTEANIRNKTPRELDLEIWQEGSTNINIIIRS